MWVYEDSPAALRDVLRLSRAMTFKAAVANLPLGGGKGVIMVPAAGVLTRERRHAALLDFGDTVQALAGRYITAEDVGTSTRDMGVIAERTRHVAGLPRARGGSGDPSAFTALGVESAIRACCERIFGSSSLTRRRICVIGLGHVGSKVAKRCARAGAKLVLADVDRAKRSLADQLGARWTTPGRALVADVDVLSDAGYDPGSARRRVRGIGDTLNEIFDHADSLGTTPLAAAMELARARLSAASTSEVA